MLKALEETPGLEIAIDLAAQSVIWGNGEIEHFQIEPYRKQCLLSGMDEAWLYVEPDAGHRTVLKKPYTG